MGARPGQGRLGGSCPLPPACLGRGWADAQQDRHKTQLRDVREESEDERDRWRWGGGGERAREPEKKILV